MSKDKNDIKWQQWNWNWRQVLSVTNNMSGRIMRHESACGRVRRGHIDKIKVEGSTLSIRCSVLEERQPLLPVWVGIEPIPLVISWSHVSLPVVDKSEKIVRFDINGVESFEVSIPEYKDEEFAARPAMIAIETMSWAKFLSTRLSGRVFTYTKNDGSKYRAIISCVKSDLKTRIGFYLREVQFFNFEKDKYEPQEASGGVLKAIIIQISNTTLPKLYGAGLITFTIFPNSKENIRVCVLSEMKAKK